MPDHSLAGFLVIAALSVGALIVSSMLFVKSIRGGAIVGCGAHSGCDAVQKSRWARLGKLPVAGFGVLLYGMVCFAAAMDHLITDWQKFTEPLLIGSAWVVLGSAIWFTLLQWLVIRRFCAFCMTVHLMGTALAMMLLLPVIVSHPFPLSETAAGMLCVVVLITLQFLFPPKMHESIPAKELLPALPAVQVNVTESPVISNNAVSDLTEKIWLVGGRVSLDVADWPIIGSRQAKQKLGLLFDITCEECRRMYRLLPKAANSLDIAFVTVPVPIHPCCNPGVQPKATQNPSACEFAKLFMTLWQMDRKVFAEFERWLMLPVHPPAYLDARNKALRSVDAMKLNFALMDSRASDSVNKAVSIYRSLKVDKMPQLLLSERVLVGQYSSVKELIEAISPISAAVPA